MSTVVGYALTGAFIAVVTGPFPGTSLLLLFLEIGMIVHLARNHGQLVGIREIGTTAAVIVTLGKLLQAVSIEILKFLPVLGWMAGAVVAAVFILLLGWAAERYYVYRSELQPLRAGG
jgi:uncharacterized protein (DUF697 family)